MQNIEIKYCFPKNKPGIDSVKTAAITKAISNEIDAINSKKIIGKNTYHGVDANKKRPIRNIKLNALIRSLSVSI